MTPEDRKFSLMRVVWQTQEGTIVGDTRSVLPDEMPQLLNRLRLHGLKPLYAIRLRYIPPYRRLSRNPTPKGQIR